MYRIIGADGREYGPITADQMRQWIAENRANAATRVLAEGSTEWKPLASLPEFSALFASTIPQPGPPAVFPTATAPMQKANGFAIASFILGLISVFSLPFSVFCCCLSPVFTVLGLIFSLVGLSQIRRNPELYNGRGFAMAGLVLCVLCLAIYIVLLAVGIISSHWQQQISHHDYKL
jgi:hypothetical protein